MFIVPSPPGRPHLDAKLRLSQQHLVAVAEREPAAATGRYADGAACPNDARTLRAAVVVQPCRASPRVELNVRMCA